VRGAWNAKNMKILVKRAYVAPSEDDGFRVLVDRLWPRGRAKATMKLGLWEKDIAPSQELRKWFGHDPAKFDEFSQKYCVELDANPATKDFITAISKHQTVTFVYGAKDEEHNNAVVLRDYVTEHLPVE
jgi:uncharacterized protein YeaO (DUF488 family)